MQVLLTGATGFVGRALLPLLLAQGHQVTALCRQPPAAIGRPQPGLRWLAADIASLDDAMLAAIGPQDVVVHLAWPGLPQYRQMFHLDDNLGAACRFQRALVAAGTRQVLVAGTCFEYGLQAGCLHEDLPTQPVTAYAVAKDSLRRYLQCLQHQLQFTLQWARLFYMHGPGQHPGSLLAQLDQAIDRGDAQFKMSGGEQLRDYLPVADAARRLAWLLANPGCQGVVNVCSGRPVSVRGLVERHLQARGASLALQLGHYPYPDHEPMAFWGDARRIPAPATTPGQTADD